MQLHLQQQPKKYFSPGLRITGLLQKILFPVFAGLILFFPFTISGNSSSLNV